MSCSLSYTTWVAKSQHETTSTTALGFTPNSLTPTTDISRLVNESICFSAVAPSGARVKVKLGKQTVALSPQTHSTQLTGKLAMLPVSNFNYLPSPTRLYQACTKLSVAGNFGKPQFLLTLNDKTITQPGAGNIQILPPNQLEVIEVTSDQGIARTGPSEDYSRLTPLPKTTRAKVTAKQTDKEGQEWLRLDYGGWINVQETRMIPDAAIPRSSLRAIGCRRLPSKTEVIFPLQVPVPVQVTQGNRWLTVTLHNAIAQKNILGWEQDPVIAGLRWRQETNDQLQYTFHLKQDQQWGYQLRYEGNRLVLSLRHPPAIPVKTPESATQTLTGIKILIDPGHGGSDSGAVAANGYREKDISLRVGGLLSQYLAQRGATVYMTRNQDEALSLDERVAMINQVEPHIVLSVHYNSLTKEDLKKGIDAQGVGMFWYHPQARGLAEFLHDHVVKTLNRRPHGVFWKNLALARPANAPSVLMELGFMSDPAEAAWIANPQEQERLAFALADGVTEWLTKVRRP